VGGKHPSPSLMLVTIGYKSSTLPQLNVVTVYANTMSRFPPISEEKLSEAQKSAHRGVADLFSRFPSHLVQRNDEGLIYGPYSPLL
jgi:hypothetical protein